MTIIRDVLIVGMLVLIVGLSLTDEQMHKMGETADHIADRVDQKAGRYGDKFYKAFGRDFGIMLDNLSTNTDKLTNYFFTTDNESKSEVEKVRDRITSKTKAAFNDFTILDCKAAKASDC